MVAVAGTERRGGRREAGSRLGSATERAGWSNTRNSSVRGTLALRPSHSQKGPGGAGLASFSHRGPLRATLVPPPRYRGFSQCLACRRTPRWRRSRTETQWPPAESYPVWSEPRGVPYGHLATIWKVLPRVNLPGPGDRAPSAAGTRKKGARESVRPRASPRDSKPEPRRPSWTHTRTLECPDQGFSVSKAHPPANHMPCHVDVPF